MTTTALELQKKKKEQAIASIEKAHNSFIKMYGQEAERIFEKEKMFAVMQISKNPEILNCSPQSIYQAVVSVAMSGLSLDPNLGLAHLIPRKGVATLVVDYKGMIDAYERYAKIIIQTGAVYDGDEHDEMEGDDGYVRHKRNFNRTGKEELIYVYSVAKFPDGRKRVDIFDRLQIQKRKEQAQTAKVWDAWPEEMAIKSLLRYQSKFLPKRPQINAIMEVFDKEANYKNSTINETSSEPEGIFDEEQEAVVVEENTSTTKNKGKNNIDNSLPSEI